tara:strand:- start:151 stop:666 length:516 start_codon:yes stop_codon:yes gene_type:complete
MVMDYPAPDPKFEAQAIDLMKKKQDQLNQVEQTPVVEPPKPKAKAPARKKPEAKKGEAIKKEEVIETPVAVVERKPYYLQAEILAGGKTVGFFNAYKDRSVLELGWSKPSMMADLEDLMISAANQFEDGLGSPVVDTINPNEEPWRFVENIKKLFLGAPFSGGEVREIEYE